uniref:Uncharacterized protein n=1 Tax=Romanomermis culicivorax TaxID=13658 RepID=A0A915JU84_ROMCU
MIQHEITDKGRDHLKIVSFDVLLQLSGLELKKKSRWAYLLRWAYFGLDGFVCIARREDGLCDFGLLLEKV